MKKYVISGGAPLFGETDIQGSKNSAVAILMSTLATSGISVLTNVPMIEDVTACIKILKALGCEITYESETALRIDTVNAEYTALPEELTKKLRASSYLIGALTARFGRCQLPKSGGCDFGKRPIDQHICALKTLGAQIDKDELSAPNGLKGGRIVFPFKSVGATVNAIIAATACTALTVIENAAKEPHITDLCSYLRKCGADITGAGSDIITVRGRRKLCGCAHRIGSDMIECGTYICAAIASGGRICCTNAPTSELTAFLNVISRMGALVKYSESCICVSSRKLFATDVTTGAYPGFPTDLQPQICTLCGIAYGESKITEAVFDNRLGHLNELKKFGLSCSINRNVAVINGTESYRPSSVTATDLRGGAAEVICALNANGVSVINGVELIERGYSHMPEKLRNLGASISTI